MKQFDSLCDAFNIDGVDDNKVKDELLKLFCLFSSVKQITENKQLMRFGILKETRFFKCCLHS